MTEPQDEDRPPVRVKVYGVVNLTRRTYLTIQVVGLIVVPGLLLAAYLLPRPRAQPGGFLPWWQASISGFLDATPWLALLILLVEPIETYFVLRRFARKQAEQNARTEPTPSVPTP
jgi:hypothetical protein